MRWLVDENVPRPVVDWLREQGADVLDVAAALPPTSPDVLLGSVTLIEPGRVRRHPIVRPGAEDSR